MCLDSLILTHKLTRKYVYGCFFGVFSLYLLLINILHFLDIFLNLIKLCHIGAYFIWTKPNKLSKRGLNSSIALLMKRNWHFCFLQMIFYKTAGERDLNLLVNFGRFFQIVFEMSLKMETSMQEIKHFDWYFYISCFLICEWCMFLT